MKIGQNKAVALTYELEVDGQIVDRCPEERPLDYIHGTRTLLAKFEENVEGLEPGESFSFTLTPAEGYGEVDPDKVIDLPKASQRGNQGRPDGQRKYDSSDKQGRRRCPWNNTGSR